MPPNLSEVQVNRNQEIPSWQIEQQTRNRVRATLERMYKGEEIQPEEKEEARDFLIKDHPSNLRIPIGKGKMFAKLLGNEVPKRFFSGFISYLVFNCVSEPKELDNRIATLSFLLLNQRKPADVLYNLIVQYHNTQEKSPEKDNFRKFSCNLGLQGSQTEQKFMEILPGLIAGTQPDNIAGIANFLAINQLTSFKGGYNQFPHMAQVAYQIQPETTFKVAWAFALHPTSRMQGYKTTFQDIMYKTFSVEQMAKQIENSPEMARSFLKEYIPGFIRESDRYGIKLQSEMTEFLSKLFENLRFDPLTKIQLLDDVESDLYEWYRSGIMDKFGPSNIKDAYTATKMSVIESDGAMQAEAERLDSEVDVYRRRFIQHQQAGTGQQHPKQLANGELDKTHEEGVEQEVDDYFLLNYLKIMLQRPYGFRHEIATILFQQFALVAYQNNTRLTRYLASPEVNSEMSLFLNKRDDKGVRVLSVNDVSTIIWSQRFLDGYMALGEQKMRFEDKGMEFFGRSVTDYEGLQPYNYTRLLSFLFAEGAMTTEEKVIFLSAIRNGQPLHDLPRILDQALSMNGEWFERANREQKLIVATIFIQAAARNEDPDYILKCATTLAVPHHNGKDGIDYLDALFVTNTETGIKALSPEILAHLVEQQFKAPSRAKLLDDLLGKICPYDKKQPPTLQPIDFVYLVYHMTEESLRKAIEAINPNSQYKDKIFNKHTAKKVVEVFLQNYLGPDLDRVLETDKLEKIRPLMEKLSRLDLLPDSFKKMFQ